MDFNAIPDIGTSFGTAAMRCTSSASTPVAGRGAALMRSAILIAAWVACPLVSSAQSMALVDAPSVDVRGAAVDARERAERAADDGRAGDSVSSPQLLRSVGLQQSQWGDVTVTSRPGSLAGAARGDRVTASVPAVQSTYVSLRWGLGTARSAVDVGIGAGAYRVRTGDGSGGVSTGSSLLAGVEGRRDAVVPTLSVGMRHTLSDEQRLSVYAGGSASVSPASLGEFYTTRVKVEWLPTRNSSIGFEHAAVNMRFGPTSNLALRVRHGGPMIYYRSAF